MLKKNAIANHHRHHVGQMPFFIQAGLKNHPLTRCNLENVYYQYNLFPGLNGT
jgi:hypothetical protein